LIVVRHGWLLYEKYFGRGNHESSPESRSGGKAVSSIAVGMAIDEKRERIPDGLETSLFGGIYG